MARTKVLLSVDEADLKLIDAEAAKAGMSRSQYIVSLAGRGGDAPLFYAIANLQNELDRFNLDNKRWQVETERLHKQIDKLRRNAESASQQVNAVLEQLREHDAPKQQINSLTLALKVLAS